MAGHETLVFSRAMTLEESRRLKPNGFGVFWSLEDPILAVQGWLSGNFSNSSGVSLELNTSNSRSKLNLIQLHSVNKHRMVEFLVITPWGCHQKHQKQPAKEEGLKVFSKVWNHCCCRGYVRGWLFSTAINISWMTNEWHYNDWVQKLDPFISGSGLGVKKYMKKLLIFHKSFAIQCL